MIHFHTGHTSFKSITDTSGQRDVPFNIQLAVIVNIVVNTLENCPQQAEIVTVSGGSLSLYLLLLYKNVAMDVRLVFIQARFKKK